MSYELVINSQHTGVEIALLKDKKLIELHSEKGRNQFNVGDIYLAKVKKIIPSLNAAFVNVGYEKDAFLHYFDLGPQFSSASKFSKLHRKGKFSLKVEQFDLLGDIDKGGKIVDVLSNSQEVLVQIAKEPISSKGPRLSAELTLAGRYLVLVPFSDKISVSQKIKNYDEKDRLRDIMNGIVPENFGVIIRTVAENKSVKELESDLNELLRRWEDIFDSLHIKKPPQRVLGELNKTSTLLRDILNEDFSSIFVNDPKLFDEIIEYVSQIAPEKKNIVKNYFGNIEIFEQYGINKQIKAMFGRHVPMTSGAYLIVEHTEAMHVIDVNSGNKRSAEKNQESNALETNMEAAEEIARMLRLRDMGGIIAIDFIDMHDKENNRKLYDHLRELMKRDRAKHNVLPPSKFGVVEITRQRVRPETEIKTAEKCPVCDGSGESVATILIADEIENNVNYIIEHHPKEQLVLTLHPFLKAFFLKGLFSKRWSWFRKYKRWVEIRENHSFHFLQYRISNKENKTLS